MNTTDVFATVNVPVAVNVHAEDLSDRRDSSRVPYESTLGVAALPKSGLPEANQFVRVQGSDFSHSGVSYSTPHWPPSSELVLMFGSLSKPAYAAAQIVGCKLLSKADEPVRYEVRCRIHRWLS